MLTESCAHCRLSYTCNTEQPPCARDAYARGYRAGAEQMREAAAKLVEDLKQDNSLWFARRIRALPAPAKPCATCKGTGKVYLSLESHQSKANVYGNCPACTKPGAKP